MCINFLMTSDVVTRVRFFIALYPTSYSPRNEELICILSKFYFSDTDLHVAVNEEKFKVPTFPDRVVSLNACNVFHSSIYQINKKLTDSRTEHVGFAQTA